jgi:hypothetical protein
MKCIRLPILRMAAIGGFLWSGSVHAGITVEDVNSDGKVFVATVTDLANVDFITPNLSQFYVNHARADVYYQYLCDKKHIMDVRVCGSLKGAKSTDVRGDALGLTLPNDGHPVPLRAPLYSLEEWFNQYKHGGKTITLMVNANWFNVLWPGAEINYPYIMPVTSTLGYAVSGGAIVTPETLKDTSKQCLFDALVITKNNAVQIVANAQISHQTGIQEAVSGIIIVKDKQYLEPQLTAREVIACNNSSGTKARTAIGLATEGEKQKLIIMVMQPGSRGGVGWTDRTMATEMTSRGVFEAINLDNSGSSQFLYAPNGTITKCPSWNFSSPLSPLWGMLNIG